MNMQFHGNSTNGTPNTNNPATDDAPHTQQPGLQTFVVPPLGGSSQNESSKPTAPENIQWHPNRVTTEDRARCIKQSGCVLWMTGLSGSGKSTIAVELEWQLIQRGYNAYVLDGDNIRHGLNADLDFSPEGRRENIRRIAHVAALLADAGIITITAFISPYAEDRAAACTIVNTTKNGTLDRFREVFINTPLEICEQRDPKALYAKARRGEIQNFTGIQAPFEPPANPDITVAAGIRSIPDCVESIIRELSPFGIA